MTEQTRMVDGRIEAQPPRDAPGGWVCAEPDASTQDGLCGMPVESEPCSIHHPPDRR